MPANNYEFNGYDYSGYDYNGYTDYATNIGAATTSAENSTPYSADPLVDSSGYFYAPDGNASAWQGYDYDPSAYNASPEAYYSNDSHSYANGEATGGDGTMEPATPSGYYGDANGYDQVDGQWSDSAGNHNGYQQPQQQQSYSTTAQGYDDYGYAAGAAAVPIQSADGYIDHHSQSSYPAMDGDGDGQAYSYTMPAADAASPLATWEEVFDPDTSQVYYVNRTTQETVWEIPTSY